MSDFSKNRTPFDHINYRVNSYTVTEEYLDEIRKKYNDKLIFDDFRNSIYAIDGEFGYVGLKHSNYRNNEYFSTYSYTYAPKYTSGENKTSVKVYESFDVKNASNNDTKITVSLENGELSIDRLEKLNVSNFFTTYIVNGVEKTTYSSDITILNNSKVKVTKFYCDVFGDESITNIAYKSCDNNFSYIVFDTASTEFFQNNPGYLINDTVIDNINGRIQYANQKYPSNEQVDLTFRFFGSYGTVFDKVFHFQYTYPIMIYKINYNNEDFFTTFNELKNSTNNDEFLNNYGERLFGEEVTDISQLNITCTNTENEFILFLLPNNYTTDDILHVTLEHSGQNELFYIKNSDVYWLTLDSNDVQIMNEGNYRLYLASGDNWNGQKLSFMNYMNVTNILEDYYTKQEVNNLIGNIEYPLSNI